MIMTQFCVSQARAIENQVFVIAVNRCGIDGNKLEYDGHSLIIAPTGDILAEGGTDPGFFTGEIDPHVLTTFRKQMPCLMERALIAYE